MEAMIHSSSTEKRRLPIGVLTGPWASMQLARKSLALIIFSFIVTPAWSAETSHLAFVQEYVRELGQLEELRAAAEDELKRKGANPFTAGIHFGTRMQIALRTDIGQLNHIHLDPPFKELPADIVRLHEGKIKVYDRMIEIETQMLSRPKPGVDYGAMAAEMPKLRALLDSIDDSFLQMSALAFASLIDQTRPDKKGHLNRLVITKAEQQDLLMRLQNWFGAKPNQEHQNGIVGAASVLKGYLQKDYKCSDDP